MEKWRYWTAKTSVWWDLCTCPIPAECDLPQIAQNIRSALVQMGYTGKVTITAYGDIPRMPHSVREAFYNAEFNLEHLSPHFYNCGGISIISGDMRNWMYDNGPPANCLLISENRDQFECTYRILSWMGCNVLLEPPPYGYPIQILLSGRPPISELPSSGSGMEMLGSNRIAKTSVWWDVDNISIPTQLDPRLIALNIRSSLAAMGFDRKPTISAYGDIQKIPNFVLEALRSTGITFTHIPAGEEGATQSRRSTIILDMMDWMLDSRTPANVLVISSHRRDFSSAFEILRRRGFNIIMPPPRRISLLWNLLSAKPPFIYKPGYVLELRGL